MTRTIQCIVQYLLKYRLKLKTVRMEKIGHISVCDFPRVGIAQNPKALINSLAFLHTFSYWKWECISLMTIRPDCWGTPSKKFGRQIPNFARQILEFTHKIFQKSQFQKSELLAMCEMCTLRSILKISRENNKHRKTETPFMRTPLWENRELR